jgi:hypothetical protein
MARPRLGHNHDVFELAVIFELSEGWNAATASGVVPAAMKSMTSSYDLIAFTPTVQLRGDR